MEKLKKFGIISVIIFSAITILSLLYFSSCKDGYNCTFNFNTIINVCIFTCGVIGIGYCFMILNSFNKKVDKTLVEYKEILTSEKLDNDKTLSFEKENKQQRKKI